TEIEQLLLADVPFQIGTGIHAGRGMALEVDQVAAVLVTGRMEEVIEADLVQRGRRGVAGDVAADAAVLAVGTHHHGHGVPAQNGADAPLDGRIPRRAGLVVHRNGVDVGSIGCEGYFRTGAPGPL